MWCKDGVRFIALQNRDGLSETARSFGACDGSGPQMIEQADRLLRQYGASYRDVARTWFYVRDILDWYPQFNQVRSETLRIRHDAERG